MTLEEKFNKLKNRLKEMDRVIIAFSGGVDSTFLLKAASVSGLSKVLAVTGRSESMPEEEFSFSGEITSSLNLRHRIIETNELENTNYSSNPPDRCYFCKKELFGRIREIANKEDFPFILDGTNADDAWDRRPGRRAAEEEGVESPLLDAGLSKDDIRKLSKILDLPTWNKPATPCLSSRFPYGQKITAEALERVNKAETFIRKFGVKELRVRNHSDVARIEILPDDFPKLMDNASRKEIVDFLKSLGFKYVAIDLQGFRSGSFNELLLK
ncbi:MAG TPA: ATP-dependent sacrificial sulfur transferase LarE [Nitrospirae bacterium]|nr:tRNA(Ile)-lysidine synthase [bacterium BMS3Abin06]HDH11023.1 ATP-dependent sacrificial sulfur transferase LarE [Nitrospirota bacterium]HDZ01307.1 ATP-dependent sacrificial sulfur transferase LarE [Nitrospirota bacterium]